MNSAFNTTGTITLPGTQDNWIPKDWVIKAFGSFAYLTYINRDTNLAGPPCFFKPPDTEIHPVPPSEVAHSLQEAQEIEVEDIVSCCWGCCSPAKASREQAYGVMGQGRGPEATLTSTGGRVFDQCPSPTTLGARTSHRVEAQVPNPGAFNSTDCAINAGLVPSPSLCWQTISYQRLWISFPLAPGAKCLRLFLPLHLSGSKAWVETCHSRTPLYLITSTSGHTYASSDKEIETTGKKRRPMSLTHTAASQASNDARPFYGERHLAAMVKENAFGYGATPTHQSWCKIYRPSHLTTGVGPGSSPCCESAETW